MTSFHPVERISPGSGPGALTRLVLVCDHARNAVPPEIGDLGLPPDEMARHIAYDIGARGVTLGLAARLGAGAVLATFSRLVIDPNRGEDDPTLVMRLSDGTVIPGNRHVGPGEIERRLNAYYRPYHAAIEEAIAEIQAAGERPVLVSIHSFTPQFRGRPRRPWHVGLLWDRDDRLVKPLLRLLRAEPDLVVGDNEPYSGQLRGDTMWRHGTARGLPHVLIEIRNDLIETPEGQAGWAARLAPMIRAAIAEMEAAERPGAPAGATINGEDRGERAMPELDVTRVEAAVFRRLRDHLRERTDVQNIDLMNLAGFCRNCLARWYQEAAAEQGVELSKEEAREIVYGMPYEEWRARYQKEASPEQLAAFEANRPDH